MTTDSASRTVDHWLELAVASIDETFGEGYARAHPALVGAYLTTCAAQARSEMLEQRLGAAAAEIAAALARAGPSGAGAGAS